MRAGGDGDDEQDRERTPFPKFDSAIGRLEESAIEQAIDKITRSRPVLTPGWSPSEPPRDPYAEPPD